MKYCIIIILFLLSGQAQLTATNNWCDAQWGYRKQIVVNHDKVAADLTDFPVLINLSSDADLASHARSDGNDILFTGADGIAKLSHEIEKFDKATGALLADVKIPHLSATNDTILYMYYGNSKAAANRDKENVWDSNFKMVQHLNGKLTAARPGAGTTLIGHYGCWGVPWVGRKHGSDTEYIVLYFGYRNVKFELKSEDLYYAIYDAASGAWTTTNRPLVNHSQEMIDQAHASWAYFGGKYHVVYSQTRKNVPPDDPAFGDRVAEITSPTWEGFADHVLTEKETTITPDLGVRAHHAFVEKADGSVWLVYYYAEGGKEGKFAMGYSIWTQASGWDKQIHKIASTLGHGGSSTALEHNGTVYIYFADPADNTLYLVTSADNGSTWSNPIKMGFTARRAAVQLNSKNEFVMVYDAPEGVAARKSSDGIHFGPKYTILPGAWVPHFAFIKGTDTAVIGQADIGAHSSAWTMYGSIVNLALDEVKDSTGNHNDGRVANSPAGGAEGKIGSAFDFNGSNDYVDCGNDASTDSGAGSWSIESWFKTRAASAKSRQGIVCKSFAYMLEILDARLDYGLYNTGSRHYLRARDHLGVINPNQWYHVAGVYNNSNDTIYIYVDGALKVKSNAASGTKTTKTTGDCIIGAGWNGRAGHFNGAIDEVRISNTARSAEWIATTFNNQNSPSVFYSLTSQEVR